MLILYTTKCPHVDIEYTQEIYSFTFVVDDFSELFLHPSFKSFN